MGPTHHLVQKGKAVAEQAVVGAVTKKLGGGMLGGMAAKHIVGEAKKNPEAAKKLAMNLAKK